MQSLPPQKAMDSLILSLSKDGIVPKLLLHSCCAPCSSYVLEYLSQYFDIYDYFYNPNISPEEEYNKRVLEIERLIKVMPFKHKVTFISGNYDPDRYFDLVKGYEDCPERGERCSICFEMRLREAAKEAKKIGADYFATTLTISPLKNQEVINEIGLRIGEETGVKYLPSDFKKKNGYKRSIELSEEYDLYRQNFCGCVYSKGASENEES